MFVRLIKKKDFEQVAKNGHSFFTSELGFKIIKNNFKKNRYGIVVNLKVDKRSTVRNKIRRRVREIILMYDKNLKQGFDVMILTRESIKSLSYHDINKKLLDLFKKARLINF